MGEMRYLVSAQRAASARMIRPSKYARLEEGTVEDQLRTTLEQVEQAHFALRPLELVLLLHSHPRHPTALCGHRVTGPGQFFFLHQQFLARRLPLLL